MRRGHCSYFVYILHPKTFKLNRLTCEPRPGSSVGIATDYGLDGPGSNLGGDEIFPPVQTGPGAHPASCKYRVFPGGAERPRRAADHSPPSSAEVMEE